VLDSADAAAVLEQACYPYDPATELLFRDFCEFLVRLAAVRYPQLPRLELQVQQMLAQHLLPLLGGGAGRQGGSRQPLQPRTSITRSDNAPVGVGSGAWGSSSSTAGPGHEQMQEDVVVYLQSQASLLQQLFAAIACAGGAAHTSSTTQQQQQPVQQATSAPDMQGASEQQQRQPGAASAWLQQAVTVRQVAAALHQAGWMQHWQLSPAAVSGMLLEGMFQVADPEGLRSVHMLCSGCIAWMPMLECWHKQYSFCD
jgi:hypothetical protein